MARQVLVAKPKGFRGRMWMLRMPRHAVDDLLPVVKAGAREGRKRIHMPQLGVSSPFDIPVVEIVHPSGDVREGCVLVPGPRPVLVVDVSRSIERSAQEHVVID